MPAFSPEVFHSPTFVRRKYKEVRADGFIFLRYSKKKSGNIIEIWGDPIKFALNQQRNRRAYFNRHKEKSREQCRKHYRSNPEKHKTRMKEAYAQNKDIIKSRVVDYTRKNWGKVLDYNKKYKAEKRQTDPAFKILCNLRGRLHQALRQQLLSNPEKINILLDCSPLFLKHYLESKFLPGMSWENYGVHGWHIDHIIPCSSFNLSNPLEQLKCFHYSNLQPLWAIDNIKKSNKIAA